MKMRDFPRLAICAIVIGVVAGFVSTMLIEQKQSEPAEGQQQVKERRIVKFAKWMWEKE